MSTATAAKTLKVLVYSDDRNIRAEVRRTLGTKVADDLPELSYVECATQDGVIHQTDHEKFDLLILDGEASPSGGMGIAYQLKNELRDCPPTVVLVARHSDAWLATWSRAEAICPYPIDPIRLPKLVAEVLRTKPYVEPAKMVPGHHDDEMVASHLVDSDEIENQDLW